jgi:hypothetical protein
LNDAETNLLIRRRARERIRDQGREKCNVVFRERGDDACLAGYEVVQDVLLLPNHDPLKASRNETAVELDGMCCLEAGVRNPFKVNRSASRVACNGLVDLPPGAPAGA